VLTLVPGGADAQEGPATAEHVEGGDDLGEQPGVPVGDAGDEQAEVEVAGLSGQEAERGVALEHRLGWAAERLHLEPVVHHRQRAHAALVGGAGHVGERGPELLGTSGPAEVRTVDGQLHGFSSEVEILEEWT